MESAVEKVDLLIHGGVIVTMDAERRVFRDGAIAVRDGAVIDVGSSTTLLSHWRAERECNLRGMIATPGLINSHIHLTGDNLFPGLEPDDSPLESHMARWVMPAYEHSGPEDERAAARFVALQMLRQGSTAFIEAGTCRFPEAVLDGLKDMGIRGLIGVWAGDLWPETGPLALTTNEAIKRIHEAVELPSGRVQVAPSILGSFTCSDELFQAASSLARACERRWTFHMSPSEGDGAFYLNRTGDRPLVHLERIGALDHRCVVGHAIHVSEQEVAAINRSGAVVAFSPTSALRLASGVTSVGQHHKLMQVALGTDALNGSNHADLLRAAGLACDIYSEACKDKSVVTAERALEWLILGGANALGWSDRIGSIEKGKLADIAVFETGAPVFNVANSLVHDSPRAVHVFIEGEQVMNKGRVNGESGIIAEMIDAGHRVARRAGMPIFSGWPFVN
jgi:cytosine/adenosine deaminase-related metal-dependent hydrolase